MTSAPARALTDPGMQPTAESAEAVMAPLGERFRTLLDRTAALSSEWTFSKGSGRGGWLLKIHDRRKALCYVIPHRGGFVARATVREAERDALRHRADLEPLASGLESARRYPEGYLVQVDVFDDQAADLLDRFIAAVMALRGL